jgi:hypothetical protein
MMDEHLREHARLNAALRGIPAASGPVAAAGVIALSHLIREHMDREEKAFFGEDVLRDDIVVANQSGGCVSDQRPLARAGGSPCTRHDGAI